MNALLEYLNTAREYINKTILILNVSPALLTVGLLCLFVGRLYPDIPSAFPCAVFLTVFPTIRFPFAPKGLLIEVH